MATWVGHLRMAEYLMLRGLRVDVPAFLIGSVAPDVGFPDDFYGAYNPPKRITHWIDEHNQLQPEAFYARYLTEPGLAAAQRAFLLGYYAHLVADVYWIEDIWQPRFDEPVFKAWMQHDAGFFEHVYRDVDGYDFMYLDAYPDSIYFRDFAPISHVPDYVDFLLPGALTRHVERIRARLANPYFDYASHDYPFISNAEIEAHIERAAARLEAVLRVKGALS